MSETYWQSVNTIEHMKLTSISTTGRRLKTRFLPQFLINTCKCLYTKLTDAPTLEKVAYRYCYVKQQVTVWHAASWVESRKKKRKKRKRNSTALSCCSADREKHLTYLFRLTWCEFMGVTVAAVAEPKYVDVVLRLYHGIMQIIRGGGVTAVSRRGYHRHSS